MTYINPLYLIVFLPVVALFYSIVPKRHRYKVLLIASYAFFYSISGKLLLCLIVSTFSIHHFGIWLSSIINERDKELSNAKVEEKKAIKAQSKKKMGGILIFAIILHIGFLVIVKYLPFFGGNFNTLMDFLNLNIHLKIPKIMMPIGISFYTLQAISYMIDVARGTIKADKNIGRLALFMSFFPQIMEGPIVRYNDTAIALYMGEPISYKGFTFGIQRILFGLLKKIVIADRLNILIKLVFKDYQNYDGGIIALAAIFYTIQLYMEFSGTIDVVIGSAEIFNIRLPENFRQPFFSKSISEFWTRWHITLGTWFKDYIFYPLSLSKPMKKLTIFGRKHLGNHFGPLLAGGIALFCVWLSNGLWHGAGWKYIFFGLYHFTFILLGNIFTPFWTHLFKKMHLNREKLIIKIIQMIRTTIIVIIGELFFRAHGLKAGLLMFAKMVSDFTLNSFKNGFFLELGMDKFDFIIIGISLIIIFVVGIFHEKNKSLREIVSHKNIIIRWLIYYGLILFILIFGAYGDGYLPVDPIYANF